MASYHRVLDIFDRSVDQKSVECDYDIHPWDILIDGERWAGKVRLIGFVDVFFLICYSGESRFEHGIIVYKDDEAIRNILDNNPVDLESLKLPIINEKEVDAKKEPRKYFSFKNEKGGLEYTIISLGHSIGLKTEYLLSSLKKYEIKIYKGGDRNMKRRVRRGIKQHDLFDLMHDAVRLGIVSQAELLGLIIGKTFGGTSVEDVVGKYMNALTGAKGSKNLALAGEKL